MEEWTQWGKKLDFLTLDWSHALSIHYNSQPLMNLECQAYGETQLPSLKQLDNPWLAINPRRSNYLFVLATHQGQSYYYFYVFHDGKMFGIAREKVPLTVSDDFLYTKEIAGLIFMSVG
jgi:hypothetical protein